MCEFDELHEKLWAILASMWHTCDYPRLNTSDFLLPFMPYKCQMFLVILLSLECP